jgi:hypothetical protein
MLQETFEMVLMQARICMSYLVCKVTQQLNRGDVPDDFLQLKQTVRAVSVNCTFHCSPQGA